jgi:hypothetical protein
MAGSDVRRMRARDYLVLRGENGQKDPFVWEHSRRVAHTALLLIHLPELGGQEFDTATLEVAALFHDAGWVAQYRQGQWPRLALLSRPTSDLQRELAVTVIMEVLGGEEPPGVIERAARILRACNATTPSDPHATLLVEADRLDEIGPLAFLRQWRRFVAGGQAICDLLKTWAQQQEYHFWEARLNEFRFSMTRELARQRLAAVEPMIRALAQHHQGDDVRRALAGLLSGPAGTPGAPDLPVLLWTEPASQPL